VKLITSTSFKGCYEIPDSGFNGFALLDNSILCPKAWTGGKANASGIFNKG
jgi:hypothetical protein